MDPKQRKEQNRRVREKLAAIGRNRSWMNAVLLMSLPIGYLLGTLLARMGERSLLWLVVPFAIWGAVTVGFMVRVAGTRCPFCGKRFFGGRPLPNLWAKRCCNCNVPL